MSSIEPISLQGIFCPVHPARHNSCLVIQGSLNFAVVQAQPISTIWQVQKTVFI